MSPPAATPSDLEPDVLATGRTDVTTIFVAMSGRDPDGRDADYLAWHALDHRPEMHRLASLRGTQRLVSTPACRAARLVSDERYDAVDHVMTYLFAHRAALESMGTLAAALVAAGRMPLRLPTVELGAYDLAGIAAARRCRSRTATSTTTPWPWPSGSAPPSSSAGRAATSSRCWRRRSTSRSTSTGGATCRDRAGGRPTAQRTAPRSFSPPISSHDRPSSSSTASVCSPCSGARVGRPGRSSNWTGVVTIGSGPPSPTSTAAR